MEDEIKRQPLPDFYRDFSEEEEREWEESFAECVRVLQEQAATAPNSISELDRCPLEHLKKTLVRLWEPPPEPAPRARSPEAPRIMCSVRAPQVPVAGKDEWGFHMSVGFRRSVKDLDKNLRGRVLDAITDICMNPMELRGDTMKPLTGKLHGLWRYRLGNYRLVYHPDPQFHRIELVAIGGRGQVYAH